jgi:nucleoside 2-deoxyribosyltransferase-like protein
MRVIEAPNYGYVQPYEVSIFLAGGITGCSDWQREFIEYFRHISHDALNCVLFNPRRSAFDISNESVSTEQITWEFDHLNRVDIVVFWFPHETLCPITLYELGYQLGQCSQSSIRNLVIGTDEQYARAFDVSTQIHLTNSRLPICHSLDKLVESAW